MENATILIHDNFLNKDILVDGTEFMYTDNYSDRNRYVLLSDNYQENIND